MDATEVNARLTQLEERNDVSIVFATEIGTRAWGLPAPDDGHEVCAVFVRPRPAYLSVWPRDEVFAFKEDTLCVRAWDLRRFLQQLSKSSVVPAEWLRSTTRYRGSDAVYERLLAFASRHLDFRDLFDHYRHLGGEAMRGYSDGQGNRRKAFVRALRELLAARWVTERRELPPVTLRGLVGGLAPEASAAVAQLVGDFAQAAPEDWTPPEAVAPLLRDTVAVLEAADLPRRPMLDDPELDEFFRASVNNASEA